MKEEEKEFKEGNQEIKIDYDNIDVADIMDQIKKQIAQKPGKPAPESRKAYWPAPAYNQFKPETEEAAGLKNKIKKILLKLMKPFSPLIKLLILPVYDEFSHAVRILDQTNRRIDDLYERERKMEGWEYIKLLHNLSHNIVVELSKLKIEEENLKLKIRIMEKDFEFLREREKVLEKQLFK